MQPVMEQPASRSGALALESHELGSYEGDVGGPLVLITGGLHGNEPAGVLAISVVLSALEAGRMPLRGRVVGLAGNLGALKVTERFLDRDLNRMWSEEDLASAAPDAEVREVAERSELAGLIARELVEEPSPAVFLDLHSTSAGGSPFSIIGDTLQNRRIAFALPVPVILGLEESVEGALLGYFGERGHVAVGFEGGQHEDPETVAHHVAAIWITLVQAGCLEPDDVPDLAAHFDRLRAAGRGHPGVVEMRYRHHVDADSGFLMRPGFSNFDAVEKGQLLAQDAAGEIQSPEPGFVLLPLYQGQGQDGFFIGREVRRLWLRFSSLLRWLRADAVVAWFPGVHRSAGAGSTLDVDPSVARWWVVEIFHLLGYRRVGAVSGRLRFKRRVEGT